MELRVLRYFLAVAREESIIKATEVLYITQPTLSRQIMELENELGTKLFERGRRKRRLTLTSEGVLLRKRAQEIIELADKTRAEFGTDNEIMHGNISIGSGETDALRYIATTIHDLQKDYPQISYHLFSGNADDVTEQLDKGLLDFGILIEPAIMTKYDYLRLPACDVWGLLVRKDSPLAARVSIKPEDLRGIPLLTSRQTLVDNQLSGWSGLSFETLRIVATYNLIYNASIMVDEGIGSALCLDKLVNTSGESNLCFRPLEPRLEAHLNIVWKKHQVFSKAAKKFLERMKERLVTNQ